MDHCFSLQLNINSQGKHFNAMAVSLNLLHPPLSKAKYSFRWFFDQFSSELQYDYGHDPNSDSLQEDHHRALSLEYNLKKAKNIKI